MKIQGHSFVPRPSYVTPLARVLIFFLFIPLISKAQNQNIETVIQKGHELAVLTVALSPDSSYIATGSKDKSIKLWELNTGREVRSFLGHTMSVTCVTYSSDGKFLISGSNDRSIRVWDVKSSKMLFLISTEDYITDVALDPAMKFIIAGGYNESGNPDSCMIFDFKTKKLLKRINTDSRSIGLNIAISPTGKYVGFGEDNRIVNIYEIGTWKKVNRFAFEEGWCGGCPTFTAFSPNNKFAYLASRGGAVRKYDLATSSLLKTYHKNPDDLTGFDISPDGKRLALALEDTVMIWDEHSGVLLTKILAVEKGQFRDIKFNSDSKKIIIASDDNTAFVWDIATNKKEKIFTGFLNNRDLGGLNYDPNFYWQTNIARYVRFKNSLLITRDGTSLIKGKFGSKLKRWDIATGKTVMEYVGHKKAILSCDLSKDGKRLLTGGGDGKIMLWDVATGDSLLSIESYHEPIFDIHFNNDETKVVTCSWDATMKIHDLQSGKMLSYFDLDSKSAYSVIFHPNDYYIFTARLTENIIQLWEIETKKDVRSFVGHTDIISSIRLSTDQKTLLSSSWDGTVRLWDVTSGLTTKIFRDHIGAVHTAIFSSESSAIYSAGADRVIRVWDINTSKIIRTFEGHNAEVTSLLFSPDNKMLISHSVDGVTKFWDLNTGKEFFEHIHFGERDWMVKNPEGYFNGTDDARQYIHFVSGMKTYAADQFFNEFYRPDLLPKIFQNRGGSGTLKGIQGKLKSSPPPTVKIAVVPAPGAKAEILVRIIDNGAGAKNLILFHNGKSIPLNYDVLKFPSGEGQFTTYKHLLDLIGGMNVFTATVSNKDQVESDPQSVEIFSDHSSKSGTCYILSVGINQYKNPRMTLNYAKPDAESFSKTMSDKTAELFKKVELITLYDADATREKILGALTELTSKISQEDVFIFYYAGHGSMVDGKFYFIPTESLRLYDATSLSKEAIEAALLQDKFKNIKALKQLIIMDACQSGGSVELLATRGAAEEKAIAQLSRSAGIHVMASAGSEQFATEFTELGHGLFTYVLIKGLQGEADGAPKDGKVTIYELKSYIDDQVPEMTRKLKGKPQYPYTFSRGQDFPVVIEE